MTRLEKLVEDLREELLQMNARSMRDNMIFQNISETEDEVNKKSASNAT